MSVSSGAQSLKHLPRRWEPNRVLCKPRKCFLVAEPLLQPQLCGPPISTTQESDYSHAPLCPLPGHICSHNSSLVQCLKYFITQALKETACLAITGNRGASDLMEAVTFETASHHLLTCVLVCGLTLSVSHTVLAVSPESQWRKEDSPTRVTHCLHFVL